MYDGALQDLIDELGNLPGIGPKSAQRIAFHLLTSESEDIERLVAALSTVQANVNFCTVCGNVTQAQVCRICADVRRDRTVVCVVEESKDIVAIERTNEFKGTYHVLGGNLNPMAGRGAEMLRIRELMMRLGDGVITEVIIATNPNLEGEATASYLSRQLRAFDLRVSRLASGLPVGGDLEYADEVTLGRAFEGRRVIFDSHASAAPSVPAAVAAPAVVEPAVEESDVVELGVVEPGVVEPTGDEFAAGEGVVEDPVFDRRSAAVPDIVPTDLTLAVPTQFGQSEYVDSGWVSSGARD